MKNLELSETEFIILKKEYANDGEYDGELYITNENIIFTYEKGIFNTKNLSYKVPLSSIKKGNDDFQIFYNEDTENMEIYYTDGVSEFCFDSEDDTMEVIDVIKKLLRQSISNETKKVLQHGNENINELGESIYCTSCGARNQKNAKYCNECGKKITTDNINLYTNVLKNENISMYKCKGCGALIKGNKGEKIKCEYCDLVQELM